MASRNHAVAEGIAVAGLGSAPAAGEHGGRRRSEGRRDKRKGHGYTFLEAVKKKTGSVILPCRR